MSGRHGMSRRLSIEDSPFERVTPAGVDAGFAAAMRVLFASAGLGIDERQAPREVARVLAQYAPPATCRSPDSAAGSGSRLSAAVHGGGGIRPGFGTASCIGA